MDRNPINVMLIEDDTADARFVKEILAESMEDSFQLEGADRLSTGLAGLAERDFDVILLDLGLPDSWGLITLSQVKKHAGDVPIIVLTGIEDEALGVKAMHEGAQDYLPKGQVDSHSLARSIRFSIERARALKELRESEESSRFRLEDEPINVLLIEDNPADARFIQETLAEGQHEQFHLSFADRLSKGLDCLSEERIDIVLSDLGLPDSWGLDTPAKVRKQAPDVPIIVLTSLEDETVAVQAVKDGAQDYLVKGQVEGPLLLRSLRYAIERTRILKALRESEESIRVYADRLSVLQDLSRQISSTLDSQIVLTTVVQAAANFLNADQSWLFILHSFDKSLHAEASSAFSPEVTRGRPAIPLGQQPSGVVALEGKPLIVGDVQEDDRWEDVEWERREKLHSYIGVPLLFQGDVEGVLCCLSRTPDMFQEADVSLMESLAAHAIVALQNALAFEEIRVRSKRQEALRKATRDIMQRLDLETFFSRLCESVCELLEVDVTYLFIRGESGNEYKIVGSFGEVKGEEMPARAFPRGRGFVQQVVSRKGVVAVPDIVEDPHPVDQNWVLKAGIQSYLGIPLLLQDEVVGVLAAFTKDHRIFQPDDITLMEDFAGHAVIALDNARTHSAMGWAIATHKTNA